MVSRHERAQSRRRVDRAAPASAALTPCAATGRPPRPRRAPAALAPPLVVEAPTLGHQTVSASPCRGRWRDRAAAAAPRRPSQAVADRHRSPSGASTASNASSERPMAAVGRPSIVSTSASSTATGRYARTRRRSPSPNASTSRSCSVRNSRKSNSFRTSSTVEPPEPQTVGRRSRAGTSRTQHHHLGVAAHRGPRARRGSPAAWASARRRGRRCRRGRRTC